MTSQSAAQSRAILPGHISTIAIQPSPFSPAERRRHGLCTCETVPVTVSPWGECQQCFKPVTSSVSERVWADAKLREPYV